VVAQRSSHFVARYEPAGSIKYDKKEDRLHSSKNFSRKMEGIHLSADEIEQLEVPDWVKAPGPIQPVTREMMELTTLEPFYSTGQMDKHSDAEEGA
jgi:hypothetical protein